MTERQPIPRHTAGRLLLLSSEFPPGPGGIGTHAFQLARHLQRLGWTVHVVTPQAYVSDTVRDAFNLHQRFTVTTLPERNGSRLTVFRRLADIRAALAAVQPDVLVATGNRALWAAAALAPTSRLPWLAVGHGSEFSSPSGMAQRLTTLAINRATAVVAVSNFTAGLICERAEPRHLTVIPNAADGERFRTGLDVTGLQRELDATGRRVLLTVGNVSERKAQDVVIRALPVVVAEVPDVLYVIAGLPTKQAEYARLAEKLGVADHIVFTGMVPDELLPCYYNLADLFVLVSRTTAAGDVEGYGIVVQEAALCGTPAIVSTGCGLTEAIVEGKTGSSVPPDSPQATASAILSLLKDEPRRAEMARRAQAVAMEATWAVRAAAYDALLRDLVE